MARTQLKRERRRRIGNRAEEVERQYVCPAAEIDSHRNALWGTWATSQFGGRYMPAPIAIDSDLAPGGARGIITVRYRTLTLDEYMTRFPNRGIVGMITDTSRREVREDSDGNAVDGPDPTDTSGLTVWRAVDGQRILQQSRAMYRVHAIVDSWDKYVDGEVDGVGKYNSNQLGHIAGKLKVGTALLDRMTARSLDLDENLFVVDYDFAYRASGWGEVTKSRQFTWQVRQETVKDSDGVDTSRTRDVMTFGPTSTTRSKTGYGQANFGTIESLCGWT